MTKPNSCLLILSEAGVALVSLVIVVIFVILQLIANPRNHPVPFSVIVGGERRINYPGDSCHNIELNSFSPSVDIVAYLTTFSAYYTTEVRQIFVNHALQVGYDPNQLSYYGVPVLEDDEVNLYIRASNIPPSIQSVTVSVYDVEGFDQFLKQITSNNTLLSYFSLDINCLQSTYGCNISAIANLEGWFYFVFETVPTPSTLVVTLEATVRNYSLSYYKEKCKLFGRVTKCFLSVPSVRVKTGTTTTRDGEEDIYETKYLPFSIIYDTFPNSNTTSPNSNTTSPISNVAPSSQSLNVSVDLSWACSGTDLYDYIIVISVFGVVLLISLGTSVFQIFCKRIRHNNIANDDPINLQLQTVIHNALV